MTGSTLIILAVFVAVFAGLAIWDIVRSKKKNEKFRLRSTVTAYLMLLPAVLLAFLFILLPILYSLGYAFTDYYLLTPNDIDFIGFDNFKNVFVEIGEKGTLYHVFGYFRRKPARLAARPQNGDALHNNFKRMAGLRLSDAYIHFGSV